MVWLYRMTRRVYISKVEVVNNRGGLPMKKDRVLQYVRRLRQLKHARRECKDRNDWKLFAVIMFGVHVNFLHFRPRSPT